MQVVTYLVNPQGPGRRLTQLLEATIARECVVFCQTPQELTRSLLQPSLGLRVAVLLAADLEQLQALLGLRNLLQDVRVILILPDRNTATVAQGHTLRPRLIACVDEDFTPMVTAVLRKINQGQEGFANCVIKEPRHNPPAIPRE